MLLVKPVWKPRGNEESEDLTVFHLNAFRVFFEVFRKNTWVSIPDLDLLTIGLVLDIWTEKGNDSVEYATLATQDDFDRW